MERIYNIPLRKEFQKAPRYKRAKKAITAIKEFLSRHMKAKEVKIGKYLNHEIWKNGPKNPPHKVNIKAIKEEEIVKVELTTAPAEEKKEEKKTKAPKKEEIKKEEPKTEEKTEKKSDSKEEEKKPAVKKKATKKKTEKVPTAAELKEKKSSKKE